MNAKLGQGPWIAWSSKEGWYVPFSRNTVPMEAQVEAQLKTSSEQGHHQQAETSHNHRPTEEQQAGGSNNSHKNSRTMSWAQQDEGVGDDVGILQEEIFEGEDLANAAEDQGKEQQQPAEDFFAKKLEDSIIFATVFDIPKKGQCWGLNETENGPSEKQE